MMIYDGTSARVSLENPAAVTHLRHTESALNPRGEWGSWVVVSPICNSKIKVLTVLPFHYLVY